MNMETLEPQDSLTDEAIKWLKSLGSKSTSISQIIETKDPIVYAQIDKGNLSISLPH